MHVLICAYVCMHVQSCILYVCHMQIDPLKSGLHHTCFSVSYPKYFNKCFP